MGVADYYKAQLIDFSDSCTVHTSHKARNGITVYSAFKKKAFLPIRHDVAAAALT